MLSTLRYSTALSRLACLLLVVALATFTRLHSGDLERMLGTDEADYTRAISYGTAANYLGSHERSGLAFLTQVIDEYRQTGWARPFQRDWASDDAAGLRHYHPPLALYPMGLVGRSTDEGVLRTVSLVTGVMACVAAMLLALVLLAGVPPVARWTWATTAGLLVATSAYHVSGSGEIGPHAAFSLLSTLCLACLTLAVQTSSRAWWHRACVAMGLAMLTVPYWALLLPALLWTSWSGAHSGRQWLRRLGGGVLIATVTAVLAWPPLLLHAAFVKPMLMYAGIVLHPLVEGRTPGAWIIGLAQQHVVLSVLAVVGVLFAPAIPRERLRAFVPAAAFAACFVLLNLRVGHMKPLYASDLLAPVAACASALSGWAAYRLQARGAALIGLVTVGLVAVPALDRPTVAAPVPWRAPMRALGVQLAGRRVLVTPRAAGAMIRYYIPDSTTVLDSNEPGDVPELRSQLAAGRIDLVLRWGSSMEADGVASSVIGAVPPDGRTDIGGTIVSWWLLDGGGNVRGGSRAAIRDSSVDR